CNALSWIPLNRGVPYEGQSANYLHIGARGTTHQPHVEPRYAIPFLYCERTCIGPLFRRHNASAYNLVHRRTEKMLEGCTPLVAFSLAHGLELPLLADEAI